MSSFNAAFEFMLSSEDAAHQYASVPDEPPGSYAISGVNSSKHPADYAAILAIAQPNRGPAIEDFYHRNYWNGWLSALTADEVAMRIFDESVNTGAREGVIVLQEACNDCHDNEPLVVDGVWGPLTVQAANWYDTGLLVTAIQVRRVAYYQQIVDKNPALAKYLPGWVARASK